VMMAAHHTSGVTASWTLHLLAQHPDVAERVRDELDRVLGERPAPTYAQLSELEYLERVVKEAMRCYPPNPYASRGELRDDLTLGDYRVPAGSTLFYPIWAVHMDPRYWPEPDRFDPDRFTREASQGRPKFAFIPFGFGPRSCEGAVLGLIEVKLMLAVLLKRFELRHVPGHPVVPVERLVLWSEKDIRMTVEPRR
jgi:cytochrome P450